MLFLKLILDSRAATLEKVANFFAMKTSFFKTWAPLGGLFILGIVGGILFEAGGALIRFWGVDIGRAPKELDLLNQIEAIESLKVLWSPVLALSVGWLWWKNRYLWVLMTLLVSLLAVVFLSQTPFFSWAFIGGLLLLTITKSSFDMLVVASQMDTAPRSKWGFSENFCMNGYRVGMAFSLSGALLLSEAGWRWSSIYLLIAMVLALGWVLIAVTPVFAFLGKAESRPKGPFWESIRIWLKQPGSWMVLVFMMIYRAQDGLVDPQIDIFLLQKGLSKVDLSWLKPLSMWGGVIGGLLSGISIRFQGYRTTLLAAPMVHGISAIGLLGLSLLDQGGPWIFVFYLVERFTRGFAMLSLFSFQLVCCQIEHAVSQLALLTACANLGMGLASAKSGWIADEMGWPFLFACAAAINVPLFFFTRLTLRAPFIRLVP